MLEVEGNQVECCNHCEERSSTSSDSPRQKAEPPAKEGTGTDVTQVPSEFWSPRTEPPAELFQGTSPEVTVVKISV